MYLAADDARQPPKRSCPVATHQKGWWPCRGRPRTPTTCPPRPPGASRRRSSTATSSSSASYEFPNLRVAYVEEAAERDGRAFYSCLVDARCEADGAGTRAPRYRVRLPGHPILGHGKGDNQNHALIFTSGEVLQCIDANQDSYLETALMVNCVLAEFNEAHVERAGGARRCAILGFREHIFSSSLGSCGDLAASQEAVFGTLVQRVLSNPLSARQHYGHPDFVDKLRMMQQGGVSKAVRGLHLSEDIFSGFATQLGGGSIVHREYCQVGKGRDLDFNSIMSFYSKLAQGNAQQLLTRQV